MAYIDDMLEPGETIAYRVEIRGMAYLTAFMMLILLLMPRRILAVSGNCLALTDKRLVGRCGGYVRKPMALKHRDIEQLRIRQGMWGRLFGYGTVRVTAKDGRYFIFFGVAYPQEIQKLVEEAIEIAVLGHTLTQFTAF